MSRLLMWLLIILVGFWILGFILRLTFKLIILGTIIFAGLYFFGMIGKQRR